MEGTSAPSDPEQTQSIAGAVQQDDDDDQVPGYSEDADEATRLASLAAGVRDQDDLERDIGRQADALLTEQADERDRRRLDKTRAEKSRLQAHVDSLRRKIAGPGTALGKVKSQTELQEYEARIATCEQDLREIQQRIDDRHAEGGVEEATLAADASGRLPGESQRDFLIRTGKITPFSNFGKRFVGAADNLADVMLDAEAGEEDEEEQEQGEGHVERSHRNLTMPGFGDVDASADETRADEPAEERPAKRRRKMAIDPDDRGDTDAGSETESDAFVPDLTDKQLADVGGCDDEDEPADEDVQGDFGLATAGTPKRKRGKLTKKNKSEQAADDAEDLAGIDDGNEKVYQNRLQSWIERRSAARRKLYAEGGGGEQTGEDVQVDGEKEEWHTPLPNKPDFQLDGGYRVPGDIYPSLFDYQKTSVQWLWELYTQQVGGIIGDEMGLGKTIQIISFIAGLHYSGMLTKPVIIVCPATVMKQWVNEFHRWWPPMRVSIMHTSGSGMLNVQKESRFEGDMYSGSAGSVRKGASGASNKAARRIVDKVLQDGHVLVTTYSGLQTYADLLIPVDWGYAVLDEGHNIRNPNTAITIYCKELRTHNRIILSGTPMQNNLSELWSLFDFVFPMRLGTLVNFRHQFEIPIKQGGYANASNLQVQTAMQCAETLKDAISPYLLQRFKVDVAADLPEKTERVLFCRLTKTQRQAYETFLASGDMHAILDGRRQALYGIDILRKICNHPDLVEHKTLSVKPGYAYGRGAVSGKMQVVKALLEIWRKNGHKTLLFAQHRIMLDILEKFMTTLPGVAWLRMDGNTSIRDRQTLVDRFNTDPSLHVFLLTTKVGGLGVNLTGADRVIIYDPDWNPSTDVQARERAWRLGQKRQVEIYRLMTAGTIEEKIYHRQIFKQFLTNKILRDPKQRQTFQLRDLHDLFTLGGEGGEDGAGGTETGEMFRGTEVKLDEGGEEEVGTGIRGVDRAEAFRSAADEQEAQPQQQQSCSADAAQADSTTSTPSRNQDRVLQGIFAQVGIQSALSHDAIMSGNSSTGKKDKHGRPVVAPDAAIIAREAKRVAAEAARGLERARDVAAKLPAGEVSWTGQFGTAGRPVQQQPGTRGGGVAGRGRGGGGAGSRASDRPSGSALLAGLSARQQQQQQQQPGTAQQQQQQQQQSDQDQPKGTDFITLIRDYILAHGGKVYTQMLIDHFDRHCTTARRTAEFKEMLKRIAVLETGRRGRGKWALREEYRP